MGDSMARQRNGHDANDEKKRPDTPFLVVPYTPSDNGARTWTDPNVVYYECPSILIDHDPYDPANPLDPDTLVKLSVKVRNLGALSCLVTARFYCNSPATAWTPRVVGSTTFLIGAQTGPTESPTAIDFTPSEYFGRFGLPTPDHFCFFVEVTTSLDPAPGTYNAVKDRHYGQQNVLAHTVQAAQRLVIPFDVSDLGDQRYEIRLRQLETSEPVLFFPEGSLRLFDPSVGQAVTGSMEVTLEAGEIRGVQAVIDVPDDASPGSAAKVLIEQSVQGSEKGEPVGAIGVTVVVSS
ncbi:hypothetical protein ABZ783_34340 [Micromonospora sp. NPDC047738]|uniref:hypothetical protein n=1 Tax=Micromonospora sp. NPDC047738 TaxID=3155741 RepID=UPI003411F451